MKPKNLLTVSFLVVALTTIQPALANNYWFDQDDITPGFGLSGDEIYNWLGGDFWNPANTGTSPAVAWPGSDHAAFFTGAGAATSYTVRLGEDGSSDISLGNLFLNSDGAATPAANGAGDVVIGNTGDSGQIQLADNNSIGTVAGTLSINNSYNLGASRNTNFRGGTVMIHGLVSGTGNSGIALAAGSGLTTGTLTLTHQNNTYTGATSIGSGYTLSVTHLADGGLDSSIGMSSNAAANLVLGGGTLRYTGDTASSDRNFTLTAGTTNTFEVTDASTVLSLSGSSAPSTASIRKFGRGTLVLSGDNSYSGTTMIGTTSQTQGGTLRIMNASSLGSGNVSILNSGTTTGTLELALTGTNTISNAFTGFNSTNSQFASNAGHAQIVNTSGNNTITSNLTINGAGGSGLNVRSDGGLLVLAGTFRNAVANSSRLLSLGGAGDGLVTGEIRNTSTTSTSQINKGGTGTWTLTYLNTYTGLTTLHGGILSTGAEGTLADGGTASSIGRSTSAAANLIFDGGTLQYASTGPATSTDRLFTLTSGGGALDASGSNPVTFAGTGAVAFSGSGERTLILTGTNTGLNTFAPVMGDGADGATNLAKFGTGTWAVTGESTYTGQTNVSGGTLLVNGSLANTSTVIVEAGATLGGTGTIGGHTTINGTITPGNSIGEMIFTAGLELAGISSFEINPTLLLGMNSDKISITGGSLTYGGVLHLVYGGPGSDFAEGQVFNLFDWSAGAPAGSFSAIHLPALDDGLVWQNNLAVDGTFAVIPEPGSSAALLGSLALLSLLRRRNQG